MSQLDSYDVTEYVEDSYLNYSMYVIRDRAIAYVQDGLKPVQRRILYAMSELGLTPQAKYKKSARTIGDVLGKYHPHGDSACYEAMVAMSQSFTIRNTLVDGQGNWGSIDDPKSFAAMRYTESKLAPYANMLLDEVKLGTVDWRPNFDGTMKEPALLPAQLPNILLNGVSGIAVGMATDIPPHNVGEVGKALLHKLDNPGATTQDLLQFIQGPDLPTKAEIITPLADLRKCYETGHGKYKMRAVYHIEDKNKIVLTDLPHQVSPAKIIESIADMMRKKKLPMIDDLSDEGDQDNPVRIVLSAKRSSKFSHQEIMEHLCATTDLEKTYKFNCNMIGLNGAPQVKNLEVILSEWLEYRECTVRRRTSFHLNKINARLHVVQALLRVFVDLDEVIDIIRESDSPKQDLMTRFTLDEVQVEAILDMRLRALAKIKQIELEQEASELSQEKAKLESLLNDRTKMVQLIKKEISGAVKKYETPRISPFNERNDAKAMDFERLTPSEPATVVLSKQAWIRAAKGHSIDAEGLKYRPDDECAFTIKTNLNKSIVVMDTTGRAYQIAVKDLPGARSMGEPLSAMIQMPVGAGVSGAWEPSAAPNILLVSNAGKGIIVPNDTFEIRNKKGKAVFNFKGDMLEPQLITPERKPFLAAVTSRARMLVFDTSELPICEKGAGLKICGLLKNESLISLVPINQSDVIVVEDANGVAMAMEHDKWSQYIQERARTPVALSKEMKSASKAFSKDLN